MFPIFRYSLAYQGGANKRDVIPFPIESYIGQNQPYRAQQQRQQQQQQLALMHDCKFLQFCKSRQLNKKK